MKRKFFLGSGLLLGVCLLMACNLSTALWRQEPPANQVGQIVAQTMVVDTQEALFAALLIPQGQPAIAVFPTPLCGGIPRCGGTLIPTETPTSVPTPLCGILPRCETLPTATPLCPPTVTDTPVPSPTAICSLEPRSETFYENRALWQGQTPEDHTLFDANAHFTLTWYLLNTGNVAWQPDYRLHFVRGWNTSLETTSQTLDRWVYPGETIAISLPSHAPAQVGDYYSAWNLATNSGHDFYTVDFYFSVDEDETLPTQTPQIIIVYPTFVPPPHYWTPFPFPHFPTFPPPPHPQPEQSPPPPHPQPDQPPPHPRPDQPPPFPPVQPQPLDQPVTEPPFFSATPTLTETVVP